VYPDPRLVEFDGRTLTVEDAGPPSGFQWDDWCAFLGPWGFKLDAITAPVSLWHGMAWQTNDARRAMAAGSHSRSPKSPLISPLMRTTPMSRKITAAPPIRRFAAKSSSQEESCALRRS
jgi:hypothetical protein